MRGKRIVSGSAVTGVRDSMRWSHEWIYDLRDLNCSPDILAERDVHGKPQAIFEQGPRMRGVLALIR